MDNGAQCFFVCLFQHEFERAPDSALADGFKWIQVNCANLIQ
jgi:hypothetical protein